MLAIMLFSVLMQPPCNIAVLPQDSMPLSVQHFRDDSTYYIRVLGAEKDIIRPTIITIDSLTNLWEKPYRNYVKSLFEGFILEYNGKLDSANDRYLSCLNMKIADNDIYYTNLDIARVYLKKGDFAAAEEYLEKYVDMLFFDFLYQDLFWTGGTQDELIRFLDDQHLSFLQLAVRPGVTPVTSELRQLIVVLANLKKFNRTYFEIPSYDILKNSLEEAGDDIAKIILSGNFIALMKYVDKYKWRAAIGEGSNLSYEEIMKALSDSSSAIYCHLFGGKICRGKSIREYLGDAEKKNLRIKVDIFDDDYMPHPLGIIIFEWDDKPDLLEFGDFPNPYFLYTRDGWKIMNFFVK